MSEVSEYCEKVSLSEFAPPLVCFTCGYEDYFTDVHVRLVDGHILFLCGECGNILSTKDEIISDLFRTFNKEERLNKATLYKKLLVLFDKVKVN